MVMSPSGAEEDGPRVDTIRYLKFDGKNFLAYKEGLKAALKARKCWKILTGDESKPARDGSEETKRRRTKWRDKVLLINDILTNTLDDGTRVRLAHLEKPQEKWKALVDDFEKKSFNVALFKRRELMSVEFDAGSETIREYIHRVEALKQDLILMNEEVSDKDVTTALLTGLGDSYQNLVETFDNLDDYTLQQVKVKLTSREERMNQAKSIAEARARKASTTAAVASGSTPSGSQQSGEQNALFAQGKKQQQRGGKGGRGGQKRRRANVRCWNCEKWGHYAYECRAPKREPSSGGPPSKGKPGAPGKADNEDTHEDVAGYYNPKRSKTKGKPVTVIKVVRGNDEPCLMNPVAESESDVEFFMPFVLDNASGVHICGCRDAFKSLSSDCNVKMKWFDNTVKKAEQHGIVKFRVVDAVSGERVLISVDAVFDDGATNLLSQRLLLEEHGFRAQLSEDQQATTLTQPIKNWVWKFDMVDGLFQSMVEVPSSKPAMTVLQTLPQPRNNLRLWHFRLAHAGWNAIKLMADKELVRGLELSKADRKTKARCYNCEMAKMKRMSFRNTSPKRVEISFEKVFVDLGFLSVPTIEGYKMYLHVLDEGSRYQWIYLQQSKEETVQKLSEFRDYVKARHGKIVKAFHSDQGSEFTSGEVARMCAGESIQIFAHPHTPEEVCLVEKAHGVMMNKVRSVLYSSGLPDMLWGEAAAYVVETTNRTTTKGNKDQMTPHEKVFGKKPSVRHLRPFGCFAFKFVDKVYRDNKLSRRGAPTLLVGYAVKTKGYRLLDLVTGVISEHRAENVKFYEQTTVSKDYVNKLLNTVYRLRRRPEVDSTRLPFVTLPVAEVPENEMSDEVHERVEVDEEVEEDSGKPRHIRFDDSGKSRRVRFKLPTEHADSDRGEEDLRSEGHQALRGDNEPNERLSDEGETQETEESLEEEKSPTPKEKKRKRHLPVEVKEPRCSRRKTKKPVRYNDFVVSVFSASTSATSVLGYEVPLTWDEMMASPQRDQWLQATKEEFLAQLKNETWILVPRPENAHILKNKWIWVLKENEHRLIRFKARLVVLGCLQIWKLDYDETFAPVIRFETLRFVLLYAGMYKMVAKQFDFVTAFLNAPTDRVIYMEQPEGHVKRGYEEYVCLLLKSIYGLRQSPMNWNNTLHKALVDLGFTRSVKDPGLYWIKGCDRIVFVPVYVDDILIIGRNEDVDYFATKLNELFKIKELGEVNYLLGLQITYAPETHVMFRQTKYVHDMLQTFRMNEAHSVRIPMCPDAVKLVKATEDEQRKSKNLPYRSLVGCLQYLVSGSRPDLATALRILSKFLEKFGVVHWQAAKRVLRYVKGTSETGLHYDLNEARKFEKLQIEVYADASYASDQEDLKSVSGFTVFCCGQLISAKSWKQGILAESTCEAELIAANEGLHEAVWLEQLVDELELPRENTKMFCDSSSAVELMKHDGKHRRTKQLRIKDLKIREYVAEREVQISSVETRANVADTMTKPLPAEAFRRHRDTLGVREIGEGDPSA